LSAAERAEAPQLFAALSQIKKEIVAGSRDFSVMETDAIAALTARGWQPDYITVRRSEDLLEPAPNDRALVILAAARLGKTRLIDNLELVIEL
jgi:pantoate--beta-alanine ligase